LPEYPKTNIDDFDIDQHCLAQLRAL
jgi:hypothetical protein